MILRPYPFEVAQKTRVLSTLPVAPPHQFWGKQLYSCYQLVLCLPHLFWWQPIAPLLSRKSVFATLQLCRMSNVYVLSTVKLSSIRHLFWGGQLRACYQSVPCATPPVLVATYCTTVIKGNHGCHRTTVPDVKWNHVIRCMLVQHPAPIIGRTTASLLSNVIMYPPIIFGGGQLKVCYQASLWLPPKLMPGGRGG